MSLLTVRDVAGLLRVKVRKVRDLIHDHRLNAIDINPGGRPTWRAPRWTRDAGGASSVLPRTGGGVHP